MGSERGRGKEWPLRREMGEFVWASRQPIGKGTYGQVYCVPDICNPSRPVAIKEMKLRKHMNWKRELAIYKAIRNISGVIHLKGCIYERSLIKPTHLVFDLIQKVSPRDLYPKLSLHDIRYYLHSLLTSLESLHEQGIIHCDIKPDNVLIDPQQKRVTLIDFGHAHDSVESLQVASGIGTMCYNAPEILLSCKQLFDFKIDIWAVGRVLADMLVPSARTWLWTKDLPSQLLRLSDKYGEKELISLHREWNREWIGCSQVQVQTKAKAKAKERKGHKNKVSVCLKESDSKTLDRYRDRNNVLRAKSIVILDDEDAKSSSISNSSNSGSNNSSNSSSNNSSSSTSPSGKRGCPTFRLASPFPAPSDFHSHYSRSSISSISPVSPVSSVSLVSFAKQTAKTWYNFWMSFRLSGSAEKKRLQELFETDLEGMNYALDLLEQLTQLRPQDRPSCQSALKHAFFTCTFSK